MGLGIGSRQAIEILKKGYDSVSGIVLQAVPPKKVTIEQILDPIEKDLEVLATIKAIIKQSTVMSTSDINGIKMIQGTCCMTKQEYNKIKEYIENGKKQL